MMQWKPLWRRWRWRLLATYLALLALSHFVQWDRPTHGFVRPGQHLAQVPTFDDDGQPTRDTDDLYYLHLKPSGKPDAPVVVLIHGSPFVAQSFDGLVQALAPDF